MAEQSVWFELAQPLHAQAVLDFFQQVTQETDYLLDDEEIANYSLEQMRDNLARRQDLFNHCCILALLDDEVIGLVNLAGHDHPQLDHVVDVFIAVKKAYWGQGLGTALLDNAIDWAIQADGICRLELSVQARNSSAIALYQKMGFESEGLKRGAVKTKEGDYIDLSLMARWV